MNTKKKNGKALNQLFSNEQRKSIATLCRQFQVRQLGVFGSVLTDQFDDASDIDVAVRFERTTPEGSFDRFMGLKESLESLFGLPVDLVTADRIRNPVFAHEVENTQEVIYAA
jgi:predicted nucleotidyltransferase